MEFFKQVSSSLLSLVSRTPAQSFESGIKGVLLVNLGSPDSPEPKDVRTYLDQFLMDEHVIDVPYLLRALIVRGFILRTRPEASSEAYKKIWWKEGSPLIVISKRVHEKVKKQAKVPVALAMRYGKPSIETGIQELVDQGVTELLLFPMYPQYAMATTKTIEVLVDQVCSKNFPNIKIVKTPAFYNNPEYINVLSNSIKKELTGFDYDQILFSYHGVPERHIRKTDSTQSHKEFTTDEPCCQMDTEAAEFCYRTHCYETTRLVAEKLKIPKEKYYQTFQSRLGGAKWLEPYTDVEINKMPEKGMKNLAVVTPAFVSDCLETLEEIGIRAHDEFKKNGGQSFKTIPCLNDDELWINTMVGWINEWATTGKLFNSQS